MSAASGSWMATLGAGGLMSSIECASDGSCFSYEELAMLADGSEWATPGEVGRWGRKVGKRMQQISRLISSWLQRRRQENLLFLAGRREIPHPAIADSGINAVDQAGPLSISIFDVNRCSRVLLGRSVSHFTAVQNSLWLMVN